MATKKLKQLRSKDKLLIHSVSAYFEEKHVQYAESPIQKTMQATGFSRRTIFRVKKELQETGTPKRLKRGPYKPLDEFDQSVIRNKIRVFYAQRRQLPTVKNLHSVLSQEIDYPGSKETLRKTIRLLGFSWKKTTDNRKILIERPAVFSLRLAFYNRKKELEDGGYTFVYVDETWIDTSYTAKKCWQNEDTQGVMPPCNRGQRLIVVHAGSRTGFVEGAQLVYKASSCTGDYHSEMNGPTFTKWLEEMRIPNLHSPCAIVMDNASYHSVQADKWPTSSSRKAVIQEWLRTHDIVFKDNMLKTQLLELLKLHKPAPSYAIDQVIRSHGHEVLRLPPYHPEFNAIELIWSQLKYIVRHRNFTFRLDDTLNLTNAAFKEIGEDRWRNACDHVEKVVNRMKDSDHYIGEQTDTFVINLGDDTTDTASMGSSTDTASDVE